LLIISDLYTTRPIRNTRRLLMIFILVVSGTLCNGQGLSTEGTDFWVGFMNNWEQDIANNPIILEVYITADSTTSGVLKIPKNASFTPINFTVIPGVATKIAIPSSVAMAQGSTTENKGIHITTSADVSVFAMNRREFSADMATVLPTYSLGDKYYVMSHWEDGNRNANANSKSEFLIVSISDGTEIEITPSVKTKDGHDKDATFVIKLSEGQTYQLQADGDLTGTLVTGTNSQQTGCQNFALFAGNQYTKVGQCGSDNGHDHLYAQQYSVSTWGKEFITVSYATRTGGDLVKILASEDNTIVHLNSTTFVLNKGEHISQTLDDVNGIQADKPIAVAQFSRSQPCDQTIGDPFYILISPLEQMLKRITFNAPDIDNTILVFPLTIITKTTEVSKIKLDHNLISNSFTTAPVNPAYSIAKLTTTGGNHTLESQGGFIAYVYGYGQNESFGYSAGASLENLNIKVGITNGVGRTVSSDSICLNDIAIFTPIVDGLNHFEWSFGDGGTDETLGKDPVEYKFNKEGKYIFKLKASIDGGSCSAGHEQTYIKIIHVVNPKSKILGPRSVCPGTTDVSYRVDKERPYTYIWTVSGGKIKENNDDNIVVDWFDTNANAFVKLIAKNKLDCVGDPVVLPVKINIKLEPDAPFGPDSLCSNAATDIAYATYPIVSSTFTWQTKNIIDIISQDIPGSNEAEVKWSNYGIKKLWFIQHTTIDDVTCDGTSDTLSIYIQRNPSTAATVLSDKNEYQIGETANLDVVADTLYQMVNWNFGDDQVLDSVVIAPTTHQFSCSGLYDVSVNVYDTIGVCPTKAIGSKPITVLPVKFEMVQVTTLEENDSILQVLWKTTNADFLDNALTLHRRMLTSPTWETIGTFNGQASSVLDETVKTHAEVYEYQLQQTSTCPDQDAIAPQHNILLNAISEDNLSAQLSWSAYDNWFNGVGSYEIYVKKDNGNYALLGNTQETTFKFNYDSLGFDYCFRIKAIESNGNNAFSWSNISCVEFVPPIVTYNVITPNDDHYNDLFIIEGIKYYPNSVLIVYNRWGNKVKEFEGYQNNWPTGSDIDDLSSGVYYFVLMPRDSRAKHDVIKRPLSVLK
jgi:gliding motility-associated-like protein